MVLYVGMVSGDNSFAIYSMYIPENVRRQLPSYGTAQLLRVDRLLLDTEFDT